MTFRLLLQLKAIKQLLPEHLGGWLTDVETELERIAEIRASDCWGAAVAAGCSQLPGREVNWSRNVCLVSGLREQMSFDPKFFLESYDL